MTDEQRVVAIPQGWKLVPEKPTEEMLIEAAVLREDACFRTSSLWAAMLAVAPEPPAVTSNGQFQVLGVDWGKPNGDKAVKVHGYRDAEGRLHITQIEEMERECPTCGCTDPTHHPAVQEGGEVQLCENAWHQPTAAEIRAREAAESAPVVQGPPNNWAAVRDELLATILDAAECFEVIMKTGWEGRAHGINLAHRVNVYNALIDRAGLSTLMDVTPKMDGRSGKSFLRAAVEGDEVVIRIGVDTLAFAIGQGNNLQPGIRVTDNAAFAAWVADNITEFNGDETGTAALGRVFDAMAVEAV